jgi:hypothetical protein
VFYSAKLNAGADVDQEEYLFNIASLAVRVKKVPPPDFGEPYRSVIWSAVSYRAQQMAFIQWRMNPNTVAHESKHCLSSSQSSELQRNDTRAGGSIPVPAETPAFFRNDVLEMCRIDLMATQSWPMPRCSAQVQGRL